MSNRQGAVVVAIASVIMVALVLPYFRSTRKYETFPVTGRITFKEDGAPFTGQIIVAQSLEGGPRASAEIQPDGTFTLETERKGDGAVVGEHILILNSRPPYGMDQLVTMVHAKYLDFGQSPWKYTFSDKEKNHLELEVEKPGKGVKIVQPATPLD